MKLANSRCSDKKRSRRGQEEKEEEEEEEEEPLIQVLLPEVSRLLHFSRHLKRIREEDPTRPPSVVFSHFTSFLGHIGDALSSLSPALSICPPWGYEYPARSAAMKEFPSNEDGSILKSALPAGGVGINLTEQASAFMMAHRGTLVESQAIDRVLCVSPRFGKVDVIRYICPQGTIEERIFGSSEEKGCNCSVPWESSHRNKRGMRAWPTSRASSFEDFFMPRRKCTRKTHKNLP